MSVVYAVGVNHRSASLAIREGLAVPAAAVAEYLRGLKSRLPVSEAAVLSTCNRTELYCLSDCAHCADAPAACSPAACKAEAPRRVAAWFGRAAQGARVYQYQSGEAVAHLFRVASGLDSQLVGEPEIAGQVKQFAAQARAAGEAGQVINRLMERALAAAAEVRSATGVGRHSLSYPGLAARAAEAIFSDLRQTSALFVGAGDMARAGLPIFANRGVARLAVASRNVDRAAALAKRAGGGCEALPLAVLPAALASFDIVVCASASRMPIIGKGAVESALRARKRKPMMFADLALPRDLEPEIQTLPDVFVYNLDQFGKMAEDGMAARLAAAEQGEAIIARHADDFVRWLQQRAAVPRARAFRAAAQNAREAETQRALRRLQNGEPPEAVLQDTTRRLTAKLIHLPTKALLRAGAPRKK